MQVMMSRYRFAAALFITLALTTSSVFAQTTVTSEPPATFTLPNGLQVLVIQDHRTPVVTQMVWYKVGSADETPGKSGLAHFLEHLMFKGTARHPVGEFSQTVLKVGGNENAFTSVDYTGYFQRVPREQLGRMMEFEADRMTGLILKDENVLPERDVVLEEVRKARFAGRLVSGADLVPEHLRDHRRPMILDHENLQAIQQREGRRRLRGDRGLGKCTG